MVVTPWGNAAELRSRRLRPGPGAERATVEANQRERLMAAMVAAVDEHGYKTTRVADVVRISGVSRSAFYGYFDDLLDCFLGTVDEIARLAAEQIVAAYETGDSWDSRLRAGADRFLELVLSQPAAARVCLVEIYAAGPQAIERLDGATATIERAVSQAFEESPERAGMPRDVIRAIVGGLNKTVYTRLRNRREHELEQVVPQLFDWGMGYRTPPEQLRKPRRRPNRGTVPQHSTDEPRDRLVQATTDEMAERGYQEATIVGIVNRGKASLSTFYLHFESKDAAFREAAERAQLDAIAAALQPFQQAPNWERGVRDGLDAMFGFLAADPAAAKISVIGVLTAGAGALDAGDRIVGAIDLYLAPGFERAPETPRIVAEAVAGALYTLVYAQISKGRGTAMRELVPTATYVALAPFTPAEEACAVANIG